MKYKKIVLVFILFFFARCSTGIVTDETVVKWNKALKNENWVAKENIYKPFSNEKEYPIIKKNQKLRLWLENKEEWVKIKFCQLDENREQARGSTIIFISKTDLDKITENIKNTNKFSKLEVENLVYEYIRTEIQNKLHSIGSRR